MATSDTESCARAPIRPLLRWAGSKRKLLSRLAPFWNPGRHRRYIEPFAGSACLFFELRPEKAILGDTNRELIHLYRAVRVSPESLFYRLAHIRRDARTYYRWRAIDPLRTDPETRALRFLYLNRNCFNGIYRTNVDGDFNVPFGGKEGKPLGAIERDDFMRAAERLRCARFVVGDEGPGYNHRLIGGRVPDEGGRGLVLIKTFMDEVRLNPRGSEITMIKRCDI